MEEKIKTITKEAYDKMIEGNTYLVYPKAIREIPLEMSDLADGVGGFHSVKTLEETVSFSWKATSLNDYLEFVHYCFDEDGEKDKLKADLQDKGLLDIRPAIKVDGLHKEDFTVNGFAIVSSREIKIIQHLFTLNGV